MATLLEEAGHSSCRRPTGPRRSRAWPATPVRRDAARRRAARHERPRRARRRCGNLAAPPRVVMITADDTPETLLEGGPRSGGSVRHEAVRAERHRRGRRRRPRGAAGGGAADRGGVGAARMGRARRAVLAATSPIAFRRFVMRLEADLPEAVRESVGQAFRELLCNAVEWGGKLDPTRKVRISCLRARRMLLYRIADPGEGFDIERLAHAAISNPGRRSAAARLRARRAGPAAGRSGPRDHARARRRADLQRGAQRGRLRQVPRLEFIGHENTNRAPLFQHRGLEGHKGLTRKPVALFLCVLGVLVLSRAQRSALTRQARCVRCSLRAVGSAFIVAIRQAGLLRRAPRIRGQEGHRPGQRRRVHRLGQMHLKAGGQRPFPLVVPRMRRDGRGRNGGQTAEGIARISRISS